jgi:hypothetical protein
MSDIFDHEMDAWDQSLFHAELYDDCSDGWVSGVLHKIGSKAKNYIKRSPSGNHITRSSSEKDPWYYHDWYELVAFHKEFNKSILVTLKIGGPFPKSYLVPISIVGKLETTTTFKTNTIISRYLLHTDTLFKLLEVDITYRWKDRYYKFIDVSDHRHYCLEADDQERITAPIRELSYVSWYRNED